MMSLAANSEATDQQAEDDNRRHVLERAMQELSDINREAILLKDIQELPLDEMASMLDLPVGTVKSRCSRARAELAKVVARLIDTGPEPEVAP